MSPTFVIRTGEPSIALNVTDATLVDVAAGDAERLRLLRSLKLLSYLCLPLRVQGRTIGAVTMARSESDRRFDEEDVRIAEDATSRAALAVDNARAYAELQAANQLKDEFLATLSHELRTPLNAILGYARMLRSGILEEDRKAQALETLERNASTLTQMVEDVLDVSRIAAGKIRLHIQPVDLVTVLRDALATITPGCRCERRAPRVDPRAARRSRVGDPDRLQQVIWNLLSNAVKFTPARRSRPDAAAAGELARRGDGQRHRHGHPRGFPAAPVRALPAGRQHDHADAWRPRSRSRHRAAHCRAARRPRPRVQPGRGQGATFRVELPVMIVHTEAEDDRRVHPRGDARRAPVEFPTLPDICVLAVDDDPDALGAGARDSRDRRRARPHRDVGSWRDGIDRGAGAGRAGLRSRDAGNGRLRADPAGAGDGRAGEGTARGGADGLRALRGSREGAARSGSRCTSQNRLTRPSSSPRWPRSRGAGERRPASSPHTISFRHADRGDPLRC